MSEQFDKPYDLSKVREFWEQIKRSNPNIMRGISDYGSFESEERANIYLEKLGINTNKIRLIDKIFVRDKFNENIWGRENYQLHQPVSLCSLLESALEVAASMHNPKYQGYKGCMQIGLDANAALCMRLDQIMTDLEEDLSVSRDGNLEPACRYEVLVTSNPELVDWTALNLYE